MSVKTILLLALFITSSYCYFDRTKIGKVEKKHIKKYILGGNYVNIVKVPYLASLFIGNEHACGVAIISEYWLLTAAHCYGMFKGISKVYTGTTDLSQAGKGRYLYSFIKHEKYNATTNDNDIALIKLVKPIVFNEKQQPVGITNEPPKVGDKVTIAGFGNTGPQFNGKFGKSAIISVTDINECQKYYPDYKLTDNMFCAYEKATDACTGDSGGPAVINYRIAGVVSFGKSCDYPMEVPGVYTKVHNYRDWIANKTKLTL